MMMKHHAGLAAAAALLLAAGCGGGDAPLYVDPAGAPLSAEAGAPLAHSEHHLARDSRARLRFSHLAIVRLEAAGTHDGDSATADEPGVDRLVYHADAETTLTLAIDPSATALRHVIVRDADGVELVRHTRDRSAPATLTLAPGGYAVELSHMQAGDADAAHQVLFLRPAAQREAPAGRGRAAAASGSAALTVSATCDACDFSHSDLRGTGLGGVQVTNSKFGNTDLSDADFENADLRFSVFWLYTGSVGTVGYKTDLSSTNFRNARLNYAQFNGVEGSGTVFTSADLSFTTWPAVAIAANIIQPAFSVRLNGANFITARLHGADLRGAQIIDSDFRGADLSAAKLGSPGPFQPPVGGSKITSFAGSTFTAAALGTNFRGADFSGGNFAGLDFSFADFDGATVTDAVFDGAKVDAAVLTGLKPLIFPAFAKVDLAQVNFKGVSLVGASLAGIGITPAQLADASLSDGNGGGTDLTGQVFPVGFTLFKGKDLRYVNLDGVSLTQADLQGARLDGAQLRGANLNYANLKGASLRGVLAGVTPDSGLRVAGFSGAYMPDADLSDADLRSADLSAAHLYNATGQVLLARTQLTWANLSRAVLAGAVIGGSAKNAVFDSAVMVNVRFDAADLSDAKFDSAYLQGADFSGATSVSGVSLIDAAVSTTNDGFTYTESDGSQKTYGYGPTNLGALTSTANVFCPSGANGPCNTPAKLVPTVPPFPPKPDCIPLPPNYDNCLPPAPP